MNIERMDPEMLEKCVYELSGVMDRIHEAKSYLPEEYEARMSIIKQMAYELMNDVNADRERILEKAGGNTIWERYA